MASWTMTSSGSGSRGSVQAGEIALTLRSAQTGCERRDGAMKPNVSIQLAIPFVTNDKFKKGIVHAPSERGTIDLETRDALLQAIARSRGWMAAVLTGKTASLPANIVP